VQSRLAKEVDYVRLRRRCNRLSVSIPTGIGCSGLSPSSANSVNNGLMELLRSIMRSASEAVKPGGTKE
jgi:hypothetical protein